MNDSTALNAILRSDLNAFIERVFYHLSPGAKYIHGWHIDAIVHQLMRCYTGKVKRLVITIPPRHLKSIATSVAFPAWLLGQDPTRRILSVSYSSDLATKHSIDTRDVMQASWYQKTFPGTRLVPQPNTRTEFSTTQKGSRYATSIGGTLTGRGADFIIIDDPHKADEVLSDSKREHSITFYRNTLLTRLDDKENGVIIVIMQRLHEYDLAGMIMDLGDCTVLNLPAIAEVDEQIITGPGRVHYRSAGDVLHPERESREALERLRNDMGSFSFSAQYQQQTIPLGGGIVKWEWFRFYDNPLLLRGGIIVQSWDTAYKAGEGHDYSVCTTWLWHEGRSFLLDLYRERFNFPQLKRLVAEHAVRWKAEQVIIEATGSGIALIDYYLGSNLFRVRHRKPKDDKVTRMMAETPEIEHGAVYLPREAPWLSTFHDEVVKFPKAKHDDIVDSLSQYLYWVRRSTLQYW